MDKPTETNGGMSRSIMIAVIVIIAVIGAVFVLSNKNTTVAPSNEKAISEQNEEKKEEGKMEAGEKAEEGEEDEDKESGAMESAKVVEVGGTMFAFDPNEIKVKKGEKVTIKFTNNKGMHDWVLDEFNVRTKVLKEGESESITFTADKAGTFEYYCSVGNHRAQGMKGNLIVE